MARAFLRNAAASCFAIGALALGARATDHYVDVQNGSNANTR